MQAAAGLKLWASILVQAVFAINFLPPRARAHSHAHASRKARRPSGTGAACTVSLNSLHTRSHTHFLHTSTLQEKSAVCPRGAQKCAFAFGRDGVRGVAGGQFFFIAEMDRSRRDEYMYDGWTCCSLPSTRVLAGVVPPRVCGGRTARRIRRRMSARRSASAGMWSRESAGGDHPQRRRVRSTSERRGSIDLASPLTSRNPVL